MEDFLHHAVTEEHFLSVLSKFLSICKILGLNIHALKMNLFSRDVKFCGRRIDGEEVQFYPIEIKALQDMLSPETAADLQQLVCDENWIRKPIPNFSWQIAPLHDLLENFCSKAGKRTKRAVANIYFRELWGNKHDDTLTCVKNQLSRALKLTLSRPYCATFLYTDASYPY